MCFVTQTADKNMRRHLGDRVMSISDNIREEYYEKSKRGADESSIERPEAPRTVRRSTARMTPNHAQPTIPWSNPLDVEAEVEVVSYMILHYIHA
jgi:hypothetical protein